MKSKTSFFSISPAIIREDFRRFWAIPVLAFIGYFLFGLLPIITNYRLIEQNGGADAMIVGQLVDAMLSGQNPFLIINMIWVPLLTGILIFSYLHRTGSVMSVHSQPVTRNTLFGSHVISCVLFAVLPVILTGIILLIIAVPIYDPDALASGAQAAETAKNYFARADILGWMWDYILISFYILSVTVFAGMIAGTSLHHFIAAVGFNALVPVCWLLLKQYFTIYLFGYDNSLLADVGHLHPLLESLNHGCFGAAESVAYLLIALIITALALLLYRRRRLERATDGVVFKSANTVITLIFGFLGMSLLGLIFHDTFGASVPMTVFGYVAGALLAMVIIRMVIMKTIRVFDRGLLKIMIAYLIAACVFFAVLIFDLTGFESRVPEKGEVDGVKISGIMDDSGSFSDSGYIVLTDPETVALAENLHKELTEIKGEYKNATGYEEQTRIELIYFTGDKDKEGYKETMRRSYNVPSGLVFSAQATRDLQNSSEFRECVSEAMSINEEDILSSDLYPLEGGFYRMESADVQTEQSYDYDMMDISLGEEETKELYRIYTDGRKNASEAEWAMFQSGFKCYDFHVFYSVPLSDGGSSAKSFSITTFDTAAMNWLREHGYLGDIASQYRCAVLTSFDLNSDGYRVPQFVIDLTEPSADDQSVITEDGTLMNELFMKMRESVKDIGTEESLLGTDRIYYLTFWNSVDDYFSGYIAAEDIPEGMSFPPAS